MRSCFPMILIFLLLISPAGASVVINEIMYAPSAEYGGQFNEWIEIYNNGTEEANITGWLIDGKVIPSVSISSGGYAILAKNSTKFQQAYGLSSVQVPFTLSNDGKAINISAGGNAADILDYTAYAAANLAKNNNLTLERNGSLWLESVAVGGTPGAPNSILSSAGSPEQNSTTQPENQTESQTPLPQQSPQAQNIVQPRIEIIRAPEPLKFGDFAGVHARFYSEGRSFSKMRFVAYVYSPAWIARDLSREETTLRSAPYNSAAAVELSDIAENATENIALPLFLKCKADYADGTYAVRVRGYSLSSGSWSEIAESDVQVSVSGENDMCKAQICGNKTVYVNRTITVKEKCPAEPEPTALKNPENEESLQINITAPEAVFLGNNFTVAVFLKNSGNMSLDLEIYSYLYEHSAVMSQGWSGEKWGNARTANSKKAEIGPGNSTILELISMPRENITPEKYTFKVRIDDMNNVKNSEERIVLVEVMQKPHDVKNGTDSTALEIRNASREERITGAMLLENNEHEKISFWRRVIEKIRSLFRG